MGQWFLRIFICKWPWSKVKTNDTDLQSLHGMHAFINSIRCLHRSQAAIFPEKSTVLLFSYRKTLVTKLILPCRKIGQGQPRVTIEQPRLGPSPQCYITRSTGSGEEEFWRVFTIYGRVGHLGHVTHMPRTNFRSPTHGDSTQNLALIGQAVTEKMFEIVNGRLTGAWAWFGGKNIGSYCISSWSLLWFCLL